MAKIEITAKFGSEAHSWLGITTIEADEISWLKLDVGAPDIPPNALPHRIVSYAIISDNGLQRFNVFPEPYSHE